MIEHILCLFPDAAPLLDFVGKESETHQEPILPIIRLWGSPSLPPPGTTWRIFWLPWLSGSHILAV